jgi:hypothetical protein
MILRRRNRIGTVVVLMNKSVFLCHRCRHRCCLGCRWIECQEGLVQRYIETAFQGRIMTWMCSLHIADFECQSRPAFLAFL